MASALEIAKSIFGKRESSFERYTEDARRVIYFGRAEALQAGADSIAPGHIAFALLRDPWFLREIVKDTAEEELRKAIIASLPIRQDPRGVTDIPLTDASKRVLAYAALEADSLRDPHIGTEHLWLGLIQEEKKSKVVVTGLSRRFAISGIRSRVRQEPCDARQKYGRLHAMHPPILSGSHIRLEPLGPGHIQGLAAASAIDPSLYQWSPVPQGKDRSTKYVETALAWQAACTALPFAIVRLAHNHQPDVVIGSTRFWNLERWDWPHEHSRHLRREPDACEIGYTWLSAPAIRSSANTEAKLLMLTYAFETWQLLRVCFHTDARNQRSRAALERIGAKFEGVLRSHRMAADFIPRDSFRFSILQTEWPEVKEKLEKLLKRI